jgi:hypothetical protein
MPKNMNFVEPSSIQKTRTNHYSDVFGTNRTVLPKRQHTEPASVYAIKTT